MLQTTAKHLKFPISERALVARVRRHFARECLKLLKFRDWPGWWGVAHECMGLRGCTKHRCKNLQDGLQDGFVAGEFDTTADLFKWARQEGIVRPWEELGP